MGKRIQRIGLKGLENKTISFGYQGENIHTQVIIDCSDILQDYPNATILLRATMPGSTEIYEPTITTSDNCIVWQLTAEELTRYGSGRMQLTFTDDEEVIKSPIGRFTINESL